MHDPTTPPEAGDDRRPVRAARLIESEDDQFFRANHPRVLPKIPTRDDTATAPRSRTSAPALAVLLHDRPEDDIIERSEPTECATTDEPAELTSVTRPHGPLAPSLSRSCRFCRDFRPAEGGSRGWCGNSWAFSHRRMVQGDELAPCQTMIGSWWLPVDDVWQEYGDVSSHGQPTPLMDRIMPPIQDPAEQPAAARLRRRS
jgi:hypothetical protein